MAETATLILFVIWGIVCFVFGFVIGSFLFYRYAADRLEREYYPPRKRS